jgi:cullin 1
MVKDIVELTQIKMDTLVQVLAVLFKSKLLVSDDEEIDEADIQPNTPVRLFLNYKKYSPYLFLYYFFRVLEFSSD